MGKDKLNIEETMELSRALATLEDVLESLRQGSLTVSRGGESLTVSPAGVVDFEFQVSQKKDKGKLSIEISWKSGKAGTAMGGLSIG